MGGGTPNIIRGKMWSAGQKCECVVVSVRVRVNVNAILGI
jgi:hypothetical protein